MDDPHPLDASYRLYVREQLRGISHSVNRCNAEYASAADLIEALTARVARLEQEVEDTRVAIGQLREETEQRMDKAREAFRQLKNGAEHA